jgi:hypothetical protein
MNTDARLSSVGGQRLLGLHILEDKTDLERSIFPLRDTLFPFSSHRRTSLSYLIESSHSLFPLDTLRYISITRE